MRQIVTEPEPRSVYRADKPASAQLSRIPVLHSSDDIAAVWGEIAASAKRRGRPRPQNDTWVTARCLACELPLATLNVKDFRDFAQHEGLILVTG